MNRYARNKILTPGEQNQLKQNKVAVIGCGGLGGYIIEMLARLGIGNITAVDGDVFEETNLNRQLLCVTDTLGKKKAVEAGIRIKKIDSGINVKVEDRYINKDNALQTIKDHDVVVDALDSNTARHTVLDACKSENIPCVHGAVAGWYGQVSVVYPQDDWLKNYLTTAAEKGIEKSLGNPSFSPACVAAYQVAQTLKVLLKKDGILRNKIMFIDMLENEIEIISP